MNHIIIYKSRRCDGQDGASTAAIHYPLFERATVPNLVQIVPSSPLILTRCYSYIPATLTPEQLAIRLEPLLPIWQHLPPRFFITPIQTPTDNRYAALALGAPGTGHHWHLTVPGDAVLLPVLSNTSWCRTGVGHFDWSPPGLAH